MKFRKLKADEIECRVQQVTANGNAILLLYKDARCDMRLLDETVGSMNWQRSHEMVGNRLYCNVSIWDEKKAQWITKSDVGTESNTEQEKGQASDSFKRACFNWGIGRELYSAPFTCVKLESSEVKENPRTKKPTTYTKFHVYHIGYDSDGNINELGIKDEKDRKRFQWMAKK